MTSRKNTDLFLAMTVDFFHESEINLQSKSISEGYTVQFATLDGYPNPKALNVSIF